ncbi:tRNA lysidine(34) synthetase TilS [Rothia halotolerans]|uniref:tRNA lysidine(34) synthetase TilS n=1 Tax=Rothia halotolerans TaxID=405770 RepID=UPI00101C9016|nr:tRNA lysidine(34) synthetase TilS [Rothia halotolerans]
MAQSGREGRLNPTVGAARGAFAEALRRQLPGLGLAPTGRTRRRDAPERERPPLVLVACSGGADSLALASVAAHFARRGDLRVGAAVIDHGLQEGSAEAAAGAVAACRGLGLEPVLSERVEVRRDGGGLEMAAREARYEALERIAARHDAVAVLLGHTLDDQAETVLLGLSRGSGTRSLSGMPEGRALGGTRLIRPLLALRREQTEEICAAEGLEAWQDPSNEERSFLRNRIRHDVVPHLEEHLGPGIRRALARTASVLGPDAELIEELADRAAAEAAADPAAFQHPDGAEEIHGALLLSALREQHPALRRRVLARAVVAAGGESPSHERLGALEALAAGTGNAGPVQMAGRVAVWRRRPLARRRTAAESAAAGALLFAAARTAPVAAVPPGATAQNLN